MAQMNIRLTRVKPPLGTSAAARRNALCVFLPASALKNLHPYLYAVPAAAFKLAIYAAAHNNENTHQWCVCKEDGRRYCRPAARALQAAGLTAPGQQSAYLWQLTARDAQHIINAKKAQLPAVNIVRIAGFFQAANGARHYQCIAVYT